MNATVRSVIQMVAGLAVGGGALLLPPAAAHATDYGNWAASCFDVGRGCMWEGARGSSLRAGSQYRDSNFSGDGYNGAPASHPLNDHVRNFENTFSTLRLRAYHDANYQTGSSCIGPHVVVGPYAVGSASGLSSFKSC